MSSMGVLFRSFAALAATAALGAAAAGQDWPRRPATSPETAAAMAKADAGDPADLLKLADQGRSDAQYFAGGMLIFGRGKIARDPARGCAYEEKASAIRADAMHLLGECHERGLAGKVDRAKAEAAYGKAADMGYPKSKCALGEMLLADPARSAQGLALCKAAAQAGDADAQTRVGDVYRRGRGAVRADAAEARRWYEMAVQQQNPAAARSLGEMYARGEGGKRSGKKAMESWRVAEAAGDPMVSILVGDHLFSELTGGKPPGPGTFAFRGGIQVADIEVVEQWYRDARDRDPRPDVRKRAEYALSVLSSFKKAGQAVSIQQR